MNLRAWARRLTLPLGSVGRNLAIVGGLTAIGQGALIFSAPVIARLYDPTAFGLLSVYTAVLSVLVAVASLRYDFAIPIARDRSEAVHLVALSVLLALVSSLALALVILVWGPQLASLLGVLPLVPLLWLLPIALFVASTTQALASWAVYERSFEAVGRMRAVQGLGQAICQAVFGVVQAGPGGLMGGDLAGRALGTQQLVRSLFASLRSTPLSFASVRRRARASWGFARVMTSASLLSALALQLPFLLIPVLFDLESSGQYFLAYRVLFLPASLVAAAVSQVFFGEAAFRRGDPREFHDLARNTAVALLVFSIPTYGVVTVVGAGLIRAVFGDAWTLAGQYAQIIAPWLLLWSVASPISTLLLVGRRERESLVFTAAVLAVEAIALGIGAALHSLTVGIFILSITSVILTVGSLWRFLRVAAVRLSELVRPASRIVALTAPSLVAVTIIGAALPALLLLASVAGWAIAVGLAARKTPELHELLNTARRPTP